MKIKKTFGINCLGLMLLTLLPASSLFAADGASPDLGVVLQRLGFQASDKQKLLSGEMLSNDPKESTDKELAVTIVAYVPADIKTVVNLVREHKVYHTDETILQNGAFGAKPAMGDLKGLTFSGDELDELTVLLESKPGSDFNLSDKEYQQLQATRKQLGRKAPKSDPAAAAAVMDVYRKILTDRMAAYAVGGLSGIEPYARGGRNQASPADELKAALQTDFVSVKQGQGFLNAFRDFPKKQPDGLESQFLWIKQEVDKRPCATLVHNLIEVGPTHAYMAQRQIYVGHSYNSLQILVACLPVENGAVVFYRNRTSTDQVAGFGSSMRHKIGRGMMRSTILEKLEAVRKTIK